MWGFPGGTSGQEPTCQCRRHKRCGFDPSQEDPHSSMLAWRIPMDRGAWQAKFHRVLYI